MNLLIDVGNSSVKYLYHHNETLSDISRVNSVELNEHYFNQHWWEVKKIIVASVGKTQILTTIMQWAASQKISCYQVKTELQRFSIAIGYQIAEQFGVDRWLALLGAASLFPNRCCLIIDAGTATTVDLLTATGKHLGGWIIPGLDIMTTSLTLNTSNIQLTTNKEAINKEATLSFAMNTNDNVINGCLAATVGAIELAIDNAVKKTAQLDHIILTGGNANLLSAQLKADVTPCEKLVFFGLARYLN